MRQTGRTQRMLQEAIKSARAGRAAYVVAANATEQSRLRVVLRSMLKCEPEELCISVETPRTLLISWVDLKAPGAHPNCEIFVDHFAIESHFSKMLEELYRYDDHGSDLRDDNIAYSSSRRQG